MDIIAMIQAVPGVGPFLPYIMVALACCAIVAAQLPPPKQIGSFYGAFYRVVNLIGQNYNYARNVPATPATRAPSSVAAVALLVGLTAPFAISACSAASGNSAADIAALEAGLTAAESVAAAYVRLPICTGTNGPLCSDGTVTAQIKAADAKAYVLVKAVEQAADDPSALATAQAAVTALSLVTDTLPKQGG